MITCELFSHLYFAYFARPPRPRSYAYETRFSLIRETVIVINQKPTRFLRGQRRRCVTRSTSMHCC